MIRIRNLRLEPGEAESLLRERAARKLRVPVESISGWRILKKSLDARKKSDIHYLYTVAVTLRGGEGKLLARNKDPQIDAYTPRDYRIPQVQSEERPVVVGFGPAGMFAGLSRRRPAGPGEQRPVRRGRRRDLFRRQAQHRHP